MAGGGGFFRQKYRGGYSTPGAAKFNAVLDEATAKADAAIPEKVYADKVTKKTPEQLLDEWEEGTYKNQVSPELLKDIRDTVSIEDFKAWVDSRNFINPEKTLKRLDSDLGRIDSSIKYIFDYNTVAPDHYVDNYGYSDHVYYPFEYGDSPQLTSNRTTGTNENFVKNSELAKNNKYTPTEQKPTGWRDRTSSYTFNPLYSYKFIDPNLSPYRQSRDAHTGQVPESPNVVNTLEPSTIFLNRLLGYEQPKSSGGKLTGLGYAGLTGLALAAPYLKQDNTNEQSQTQVPYRMEPEAEEETFGLDLSTSVPKEQYVSPTSSDNSVNNEEPVDEVTGGFVFPQKLPPLGATLDSVDSPDTADIPEELDTPLLRNASWDLRKIAGDATRLVPMPSQSRQRGARPPLKSGYELPSEARSLTEQELAAQMAGYRIASGTRYTPEQHKSNNRINYQDVAKQMLGASKAVNNLAREAYDFNKYQNSQKPEATLAQSLLRAQQESRASRGDTGLQQYRYQSLLNSGLKGMTPDEAIRSGLLTPEQIQVLMRGPY